jgi:cyclic lactone autoinducer peptide
MRKRLSNVLNKVSRIVAPLTLALAIITANSTCYFFSYQPDVPQCLKKYCIK